MNRQIIARDSVFRAATLISALSSVLLLGACNKSEQKSDVIELKVGVPQGFGYFAALWQRNVQAPGVQITYDYFPDSTDLSDAINAGQIDLEDQGEIGPIEQAASGSKNKVVACTGSNGRNSNIIVRPESSAQKFSDLKGLKIAYAQNNNHKLFVLHLLNHYHLEDKDIQSVNLVGPEAVTAFVTGQVAATSQNSPTAAQILEKVPGSRVIETGDNYGISNLYCVFATPEAIAKKASAIREFLKEYQKTMKWAKANPNAFASLVAPKLGASKHAIEVALNNNSDRLEPINETFLAQKQAFADEIFSSGIIKKKIDVRDLFVTDFNDVIDPPSALSSAQ